MNNFKLFITGIVISITVSAIASTGFLDEASQYQESTVAWIGK